MLSNTDTIKEILNSHYRIRIDRIELLREGGSRTYTAYSGTERYFVKEVGSAFSDTFVRSTDINLYLQNAGFAVPHIIFTSDGAPHVTFNESRIALYEFLESQEIDMARDAEEAGDLVGRLHNIMKGYAGKLITHGYEFYIGRYIRILRDKHYSRVGEFETYGNELWERIETQPRGYSHGDMYCGNILRGTDGRLYVMDFDTSCLGLPMYDVALICNRTDYFKYDCEGLGKTQAVFNRFYSTYVKHMPWCSCTIDNVCDLIALYHFALQATIIEIYGYNCVQDAFFDSQFDWLEQWQEQCGRI